VVTPESIRLSSWWLNWEMWWGSHKREPRM